MAAADKPTEDAAPAAGFCIKLCNRLLDDVFRFQTDNFDRLRFASIPKASLRKRAMDALKGVLRRRHYFVQITPRDEELLRFIIDRAKEFESAFRLLGDDKSRALMVELFAFRILGNRHVKLSNNTPEYWKAVEIGNQPALIKERRSIQVPVVGHIHHFDLNPLGYPIQFHAHPLNVINIFILRQYEFRRGTPNIAAEEGDIVVDLGACYGDSALYFAWKVGATGRVFAFEFVPDNLEVFRRNCALNPSVADQITIVPSPASDESGKLVGFDENGPATNILSKSAAQARGQARTVTIDEIVMDRDISRVDFIKMDIEGSELAALKGAENTLRKHRPKLAISVYHLDDDLITIPKYLDDLSLGYEFHLDHFTIHREETVLFARPT